MKRKIMIISGFIFFIMALPAFAAQGMAILKTTGKRAKEIGQVMIKEVSGGIRVEAKVSRVKGAGNHGFHIHQFGSCENDGKAAGGHFNPSNVKHGLLAKDGFRRAHAGDLGNILIDKRGEGALAAFFPGLSLTRGKYNVAGRAFVLHAKPDNFGQPTGNAGARIACGTIMITSE